MSKWTDFMKGKMGPYMKRYGSHKLAVQALGRDFRKSQGKPAAKPTRKKTRKKVVRRKRPFKMLTTSGKTKSFKSLKTLGDALGRGYSKKRKSKGHKGHTTKSGKAHKGHKKKKRESIFSEWY